MNTILLTFLVLLIVKTATSIWLDWMNLRHAAKQSASA